MASNQGKAALKNTIVNIQAERQMLADGTLIYTPLHIAEAGLEVSTKEAARITGQSMRQIQHLCDIGFYLTARQKTSRPKSQWLISRREVLAKKQLPGS